VSVVLLGVVQGIFGWDQAIDQGKTPDHAISIEIGGFLGALAIAGLVALVAYFVGRKSGRAASIAFPVAVCFLMFSVVNAWVSRVSKRTAETPRIESFGEFTFEVPAHWTKEKPVLPQTEALLVLNGSMAGSGPHGLVQVDAGQAVRPLTREMAGTLAGTDGHMLPDPILVDGIEGIKIERPGGKMTVPHIAVVLVHEGKAYVIVGADENGADVNEVMEHIFKTWKWNNVPSTATSKYSK
jgi:hypothetical protein